MLKKYPIDRLKEGMVVGQTVYAEDMSVILDEGTILDDKQIESLKQQEIFFVRILVSDGEKSQPKKATADKKAAVAIAKREKKESSPLIVEADEKTPEQLEAEGEALWQSVWHNKEAKVVEATILAKRETATKNADTKREEPSVSASGIVLRKTSALEQGYIEKYEACFLGLKAFYDMVRVCGSMDTAKTEALLQDFAEICVNAKAITHIYNMETVGEYTLHHNMRVAILAGLMGQWLKMQPHERQILLLAGIIMDIGYTAFATDFLKKIAQYTPEERRLMQKHVRFGYDIVLNSSLPFGKQVAESILQHHERNDGSGYPQGLKRSEICKFARILAILDTYDAMASRRFYAKRRSPFEVFSFLTDECIAGRLDAEHGVLFIRHIAQTLNGNWVKLSNGVIAKIVYIAESRIKLLPIVQTTNGDFLDLNTMPDVQVVYLLPAGEIEEKEAIEKESAVST